MGVAALRNPYLRTGQQHQIGAEDGLLERECRAPFVPEIDVCDGLDAHRLRPLVL